MKVSQVSKCPSHVILTGNTDVLKYFKESIQLNNETNDWSPLEAQPQQKHGVWNSE